MGLLTFTLGLIAGFILAMGYANKRCKVWKFWWEEEDEIKSDYDTQRDKYHERCGS